MTDEELLEADSVFSDSLNPDKNEVFEPCDELRSYCEKQRKLIRRELARRHFMRHGIDAPPPDWTSA
jgi:hypothetical protein